jgi:hypothetical protein
MESSGKKRAKVMEGDEMRACRQTRFNPMSVSAMEAEERRGGCLEEVEASRSSNSSRDGEEAEREGLEAEAKRQRQRLQLHRSRGSTDGRLLYSTPLPSLPCSSSASARITSS